THGRTNSATASYASDSALAACWPSRGTLGAAGIGRKKPDELTRGADATIKAAHATGFRFILALSPSLCLCATARWPGETVRGRGRPKTACTDRSQVPEGHPLAGSEQDDMGGPVTGQGAQTRPTQGVLPCYARNIQKVGSDSSSRSASDDPR